VEARLLQEVRRASVDVGGGPAVAARIANRAARAIGRPVLEVTNRAGKLHDDARAVYDQCYVDIAAL
jgi:hypothetical protein